MRMSDVIRSNAILTDSCCSVALSPFANAFRERVVDRSGRRSWPTARTAVATRTSISESPCSFRPRAAHQFLVVPTVTERARPGTSVQFTVTLTRTVFARMFPDASAKLSTVADGVRDRDSISMVA